MSYDVLIAGGGPAGLSAALTLGRARKHVPLCDAGARRNAAAAHLHNFVTRDGTPPDEFRRIGREQLAAYATVEIRDARVDAIAGAKGAFRATVGGEPVEARRVLLCTGMIDEPLAIPGFREHWGQAVFQCPYCHGFEVRDRAWGYLASAEHAAHAALFTVQLTGWSSEVTLFTNGAFELPEDASRTLRAVGVRIEEAPIARLVGDGQQLEAIELASATRVPCEALFAHPPQRQTALVEALGLALDEAGFVTADPMTRETSTPGIYAAGDLTTRMQAAIAAAATGMQAGAMINHELMMERATAATMG